MASKVATWLMCGLACSLSAGAAWADGAVYAMTNALENNEVLVYTRAANGNLSLAQTIATGGGGSGFQLTGVDSLGSAGAMQLDPAHRVLFVANTESAAENEGAPYNTDCRQGTITSFVVGPDGTLTFADRVFSRGLFPNSLTVTKGKANSTLLYVLNAGGPEPPAICNLQPSTAAGPGIAGFTVDQLGHMKALGAGTQAIDPGPASASSGSSCLATSATAWSAVTGDPAADFQCGLNPPSFARSPAQIAFTPDGTELVVTIKGTNTIDVFKVDSSGAASPANAVQASLPALPTFFGIAFDAQGHLLVAEPFGSSPTIPSGGQGAVSSFNIGATGGLSSISSHVTDQATMPCCIAVEPTGTYAYVANNLSGTIASYAIARSGGITLLSATAGIASGPNDVAIATENGVSFLYVVAAGSGTVGAFRINADGSLTAITGGNGLPANRSAQGLAAY